MYRVLKMYYRKKQNMRNIFKSKDSRVYSTLSKHLKMKKAKIFEIIHEMQPFIRLERYVYLIYSKIATATEVIIYYRARDAEVFLSEQIAETKHVSPYEEIANTFDADASKKSNVIVFEPENECTPYV